MVRMLRTLFDKVIGSVKGVKNKYPVKHVEGCDNIVIDSSILCCPICYNVYASVPSILKCGHTFCTACLQRVPCEKCTYELCAKRASGCQRKSEGQWKETMIRNETPTLNERYELVFHCPLCREQCTYSNLTKNYLVEDLLQSIQEVPQNVEDLKRFSDEGARIIRKRLEGRNKELEQQVNKLQDELGKREKREKEDEHRYLCSLNRLHRMIVGNDTSEVLYVHFCVFTFAFLLIFIILSVIYPVTDLQECLLFRRVSKDS